jgi:arabinogalactan endo-1,4-beta-galactosidase
MAAAAGRAGSVKKPRLTNGAGVAGLALILVATTSAGAWAASSAPPGRSASVTAAPGSGVPSVNWALSGQATATSAQSGDPASNAADGSASTSWCGTSWTDSLTVDLGQVRSLDGLGITLADGSPSATATISIADQAGGWQTLPTGHLVALDAGNPLYIPVPTGHAATARYARLNVISGTGAPVCVGEFRLFGPDQAAAGMERGADLSFTPQELAAGARFTARGVPGRPVPIMRQHGANYVRLRLWVNPPPGYNDLTSDLAMARTVKAAGMKLYLDIMYSDFWADPQHQDIPAAWQGQDLQQLAATVQNYTHQVIAAFAAQRTPVDMVSIGNEIRNGMLWPVGEVNPAANTGWDNLATLLKAGVAGARAGNPPGQPLDVMLHFDQGGDNQQSQAFYQNLVSRGVPFDVIGLSYYPFFHGPIESMRQNVAALATQFHKKIVIAETQYPWTLANGDSTGNFVWQPSQVSPGYPASAGGQLSFVSDEMSILAQVPDGLGAGLFYWAPEWIPGVGWEPGAGTPNDNLTLFDFQGGALPSVGSFQNPAAVCASYDPGNVPCTVG